ncbi:MAG: helix-turn-helix transcriptional regulator [Caldisericia bacterium]|nr:helix-turn-helix transcriptional regulator [Caldisericia bacterium]
MNKHINIKPKQIVNNLKRILTELGVKQTEFATVSGLSISTISKICSHVMNPGEVTKNKIIRVLNEKLCIGRKSFSMKDVFPDSLNEVK